MQDHTAAAVELAEEIQTATASIRTQRPDAIAGLFAGNVPGRPGAGGQYFTTFDTAAGMLRDYAGYTIYPTLKQLDSGSWSREMAWSVLRELGTAHASFLGYCGLTRIQEFHTRLLAIDPAEIPDEEAKAALRAYSGYVNRVNAWSHHEFPWSVGDGFRYPEAEPDKPSETGLQDPIGVSGSQVSLTWEPLGITVRATLAENQNPALCAELLACLPFTVLQDHSAVSGESIFAWTPLVTTVNAPVRERVCDAPVGRIRYQQATGQKLVVAYGRTTETGLAPVLGQIREEDLDILPDVGAAVFESNFRTKEPIWLTVEKLP